MTPSHTRPSTAFSISGGHPNLGNYFARCMQHHQSQNAPMSLRSSCLRFGFCKAANWPRERETQTNTIMHPIVEGSLYICIYIFLII